MSEQLATVDFAVMGVYLLATLALGLWIGRRIRGGQEYFLAGRSLPWWVIGMSLVASDIGGTDIIGVGGAAYSYGLAVGNFEWIGCVPAMVVAAFIFIPFFWRTGVYTIPEFMERRYNPAVRVALAACWLVFMACNLGVMLFASAKMMTETFGLDLSSIWLGSKLDPAMQPEMVLCILLTAALVGVYTVAGGLAAVVYTDMIQCVVMIGGCLLVVVIGIAELGGIDGLLEQIPKSKEIRRSAQIQALQQERSELLSAAKPNAAVQEEVAEIDQTLAALDDPAACRDEHTKLILPVDTTSPFPWTGILFGLAFVLSPAYWIGNQAIVQRSLGAKTEFQAKAAYIWGALLKNVIPLIIAIPGLIAFAMFPELDDGDRAFPRLATVLLPTGLRGVFMAAFLAALMSSVDSYLNSAATILTHDFYRRFWRPSASDAQLLSVGRWTTVGLVAWAIVFALAIMGMQEQIYTIFQTLMAFFQGPALAILLAGVLWRRATGTGAFVGFLAGVLTAVGLFVLSQPEICSALGWEPLFKISAPFLYFSIWAFLVTVVFLVTVSLLTPPEPDAKIRDLIYHGQGAKP